ncbi:MAG: hypothetical protein WC980_01635 [Candidatus Brocadiia bacterium]
MPADFHSDEFLVSAYLTGDKSALETLLKRYFIIILAYLHNTSFYGKDEAYIEDIRSQAVLTIINEIQDGHFQYEGQNSFRKWVFTIVKNECLNQDRKRRKHAKPFTEAFPDEPTGFPDDLIADTTPDPEDYEDAERQLTDITAKLTPEELKLMVMISNSKPYKEILEEPEFAKYSLDYLKRKIYIIRNKMKGNDL